MKATELKKLVKELCSKDGGEIPSSVSDGGLGVDKVVEDLHGKDVNGESSNGRARPLGSSVSTGSSSSSSVKRGSAFSFPCSRSSSSSQKTTSVASPFSFSRKAIAVDHESGIARNTTAMKPVKEIREAPGPGMADESDKWKEKGNEYFKRGDWDRAYKCYTKSLGEKVTSVAYANRAMVLLKLKKYESAERDCDEALKLDPDYVKAYLRRGSSRKEQKKYLDAIEDFEYALRFEHRNKTALESRDECLALLEEIDPSFRDRYATGQRVYFSVKRDAVAENKDLMCALSSRTINKAASEEPEKQEKGQYVAEIDIAREGDDFPSIDAAATRATILQNTVPVKANDSPIPSTEGKIEDVKTRKNSLGQVGLAKDLTDIAIAVTKPRPSPQTGVEFERTWRGMSNNEQEQAAYLQEKIDPEQLPSLLKQALTPNLLYCITRVVLQHLFKNDAKHGLLLLEFLTKTPRFDMNAMLLTKQQKTILRDLWSNADLESVSFKEEADSIKSKFRL